MTSDARPFVPADLRARVAAVGVGLDLAFRPMFGGIMAYADRRPFASLSNVGLGLKLGEADRAALLALPGAAPLRYEPDDPPSRTYVLVPPDMIGDDERLAPWVRRAAASAPAPPQRARGVKRQDPGRDPARVAVLTARSRRPSATPPSAPGS